VPPKACFVSRLCHEMLHMFSLLAILFVLGPLSQCCKPHFWNPFRIRKEPTDRKRQQQPGTPAKDKLLATMSVPMPDIQKQPLEERALRYVSPVGHSTQAFFPSSIGGFHGRVHGNGAHQTQLAVIAGSGQATTLASDRHLLAWTVPAQVSPSASHARLFA
jgi:hypothetical protein